MQVHRSVKPSSKFVGTHLYTWVEKGTITVKYLAQEHNAVPRPGLKLEPPDLGPKELQLCNFENFQNITCTY